MGFSSDSSVLGDDFGEFGVGHPGVAGVGQRTVVDPALGADDVAGQVQDRVGVRVGVVGRVAGAGQFVVGQAEFASPQGVGADAVGAVVLLRDQQCELLAQAGGQGASGRWSRMAR
jgi:hypothetical protein